MSEDIGGIVVGHVGVPIDPDEVRSRSEDNRLYHLPGPSSAIFTITFPIRLLAIGCGPYEFGSLDDLSVIYLH